MEAAIFDDLTVLGDALRSRMLVLLERHELTVGELCAVLQLPQSTVSRHLKVLREQVGATPAADQDARRLKSVMTRRQTASQQFFETGAGRWDKLREEMFGRWYHLQALTGLLDEGWTVGDLGCGTGHVAAALAPFVSSVIAVDRSGDMLQAARRRLRDFGNVEVRRGELESLPIEDSTLDAATLTMVLHHTPDPAVVLGDVARTMRSGGRLLVTDMLPHDHEEYRQQMGHVWLGFSEDQMRKLLTAAGFNGIRITALEPDSHARGPAVVTASARRG